MDFPSAVDEILAIQKKCESLRKEAEDIAKRTDRVSSFLCTLIGRSTENRITQPQDKVYTNRFKHKKTWKEILIADLKENGKSYTSEIAKRYCDAKNITDKKEKQATINTIRTSLARFTKDSLIRYEEDGQRKIWEAI